MGVSAAAQALFTDEGSKTCRHADMRLRDTMVKSLRGSKVWQALQVDLPGRWVRRIQHFSLDSGYFRITQVHRHDCFVISLVDVVRFRIVVSALERRVPRSHPVLTRLQDAMDKMDD